MPVGRPDGHVEKCRTDINLAKHLAAVDLVSELTEEREWEDVSHGPEIQQAEIRAWPDPAPGLVRQVER